MSEYGLVAPSVADSYLSGIGAPIATTTTTGSMIPAVKPTGETLMQGLIPTVVGLAVLFVFLLVFLSISNVSSHYAGESAATRAKFAFFLSVFMVSIFGLVNIVYRFLTKMSIPNTNMIWILSLLLLFAISSVTFFTWFST